MNKLNLETKPAKPLNIYPEAAALLEQLSTLPERHWLKRGEDQALMLFRQAADRVPAYKDFLKQRGVKPEQIKSIEDFAHLPTTDKDNYLRKYSRAELCWDGDFKGQSWVISTTSGSTGDPYYFPRQEAQDRQYALTAEMYLRTNFNIHDKSTLYIVAFPMGAWIGGVFTYEAVKTIAESEKYQLSIITPGINKTEVIKAVQNLGKDFDQIIIGSYAPFLKDIIEDGERAGLNWHDYKLGFVFSAEGFSEVFRDYIVRKTGLSNVYTDTLNHYGTVDLGTMSHETPLAVMIRRLMLSSEAVYESVFQQTAKLPTLTQYLPEMFYFEEVNHGLLCTANSGLPLIRYDLKDSGGVTTLANMRDHFRRHGVDLAALIKQANLDATVWNLPFVHVFERSDFSVSFFAFQIYPETIRKALSRSSLENFITGKFTMVVNYSSEGQQYFEINVELKHDVAGDDKLQDHVVELVVEQLLAESSEYRATHEQYGKVVYPRVVFWPYEDATYFKPGAKQKWVKK
jgi:phenylacetate-CoA ligase